MSEMKSEEVKERRDARGLTAMGSLLQDLRYTFRTLRRDAGFTTFAILIIGLGIGASSTVFSVLNTLLVRPLPFKDPGSLVWIANQTQKRTISPARPCRWGGCSILREQNKSFSDIAGYFAFYGVGDSKLTGDGEPERLSAVPVSRKLFSAAGRAAAARQAVHGGRMQMEWTESGAAEPRVMGAALRIRSGHCGKAIRLDDAPVTVAGVMPASFDFGSIFAPGSHIDLYSPLRLE